MKKFYKLMENYALLLIAVTVYLIVLFTNQGLFLSGIKSGWTLLIQVLPEILLVFLFMFVVNLLVDEEKIIQWFGRINSIAGWFWMIIFGIISSGPIYAWYPMMADLKTKGMKNSLIAVFLYNRAIKPQLLPIMVTYFGWVFVAFLTFYMVIGSIISGFLISKIMEEK